MLLDMGVKIEKQDNFPYLQEYRQNFPIDENTIFVFEDKIYTNNDLPYDIIIHEIEHLRQQKKIGAKKWIDKYIEDPRFRLEQEIGAYKAQLKEVKKIGDREEYAHILIECATNISSKLYNNIITYQESLKLLR